MEQFEWKLPRISVEPMVYGAYLTKHPDMVPEPKIELNTEGYLIVEVDYGDPEDTKLPFNKGDWVEKEYVIKNFRQLR